MPDFRIRESGEIISDSEFRLRNKHTSFPRIIDEPLQDQFGIDMIFEGPQKQGPPPYSQTYRDGIECIKGKWYTKYKVVTLDDDSKTGYDNEMAIYKREERNLLLKDSDWTQSVDKAGLADYKVTEWATYRQSLRDLPTASGWPHTHTLPTKPS